MEYFNFEKILKSIYFVKLRYKIAKISLKVDFFIESLLNSGIFVPLKLKDLILKGFRQVYSIIYYL